MLIDAGRDYLSVGYANDNATRFEQTVRLWPIVCDLNLLLLASARFDRDLTGDRAVGLQDLI
jgi:hypothetical protein